MQTIKAIFGKSRNRHWPALVVVGAAWLAGCATDPADVEDRSIGESPSLQSPQSARAATPPGGSYRVVRGDTLYSIAFKRGLDYRDVAQWNGIAAPQYKILVGEEIRLSPPGAQVATANAHASARHADAAHTPTPASGPAVAATPAPAPKSTSMFEDVPNESVTSAPAQSEPAASTQSTVSKPAPQTAPPPAEPVAPVAIAMPPPAAKVPAAEPPPAKPVVESAASNVGGVVWRWPSGGKMVGGYVAGDQTRQGVDIAGAAGDPVLAAADGEVVYSGNGLLGYGELIIVKHNASFLSAYGHNRRRLVAEGEKVRAGQQIAEMGSSSASRDELHFEIRKNGKPVNPLDYLPPR
ncbi:MAG: peptidoglycan DD-metalloendopeptidase family protein [Proteobacteria bacterium]|uniref:peptidoglycan DD-metalloendopeptidase family protein n=1 Tax=Rudaea sp. TaxID=2136325 RepID=UPI001DD28A68|nr:peptidoglycan DD-metalloendopeptidase family protein [Pseudomonadota bacterium]MBS0567818.1 peptidoglycan DD-metalloendopeptidase family protein [Pseudomonadota bacterium]